MSVTRYDTADPGREEIDLSPGARLREARRAHQLSAEDIASRLHLDLIMITRLEADDYENLPAPTFVRGYLYAYARLVNLPPKPIIEAFEQRGLAPPPLIPDIATSPQARSSDFPMRIATYLIAIGMSLLVIVWLQNQQLEPATIAESPAAPASSSNPAKPAPRSPASPTVAVSTTPAAQADTVSLNEALEPATETPAAIDAPQTEPPPVDVDQGASEPVPEAGTQSTAPVVLNGTGTDQVQPASTGPRAVEPAAGGAIGRLSIALTQDSWVEVYDRDGGVLLYNLVAKGATAEVSGKPPFQVVLGYANGARIEFNGVPFDHTRYIQKALARFTVGGDPVVPEPSAASGQAGN